MFSYLNVMIIFTLRKIKEVVPGRSLTLHSFFVFPSLSLVSGEHQLLPASIKGVSFH